jgi:mannose-6-phosphate isomerase-like protein (cupin superfamily)
MSRNYIDVELATKENDHFRQVLVTGSNSQIVVMAIQPGDEIGEEVHEDVDQTLVFVEGAGDAILEGESRPVTSGDLVFVPAGTRHNFVNSGSSPLKLWTVYAPPEHPDGTVHKDKAEADAYEAEHH